MESPYFHRVSHWNKGWDKVKSQSLKQLPQRRARVCRALTNSASRRTSATALASIASCSLCCSIMSGWLVDVPEINSTVSVSTIPPNEAAASSMLRKRSIVRFLRERGMPRKGAAKP